MRKIHKKVVTIICILSLLPNKIDAKELSYSTFFRQLNDGVIESNARNYQNVIEEAKNDHLLAGYATKKNKNPDTNEEEQLVTGKIELVPIENKYYDDWKRIMDCSTQENRDYLKWWTKNDYLVNEYMDSLFNHKVNALKFNDINQKHPRSISFMIKFFELNEPMKKEKMFKNQNIEFKNPKIVGHIGLNCQQGYGGFDTEKKMLSVGYVIDKNFQGKGIATESLKIITNFGSRLYCTGLSSYKSFVMFIACENKASMKVAEKCGFIDKGPVPKKYTNDLEAHAWLKKDDSNRIFDYLLKGKRLDSTFNALGLQKDINKIVLPAPKSDNRSNLKLINFNEWIEEYSENKIYKKIPGFGKIEETVKKFIDVKDSDLLMCMKHAEWPVAWLQNNVFYSAVPDSLNKETITKLAYMLHLN